MTTGEQSSARLAEVQAALAASQADLTRVERERDELAARWDNRLAGDALNAFMAWWQANPALSFIEAKLGYFEHLVVAYDLAAAELATARQELERLRNDSPPTRAGSREETL